MAFFTNLSCQPGLNNLAHLSLADRLAAKGQNVRIVMFARVARNGYGVTSSRTHTRHFICRDRAADARPIDYDPRVRCSIRNGARHRMRKVWIVNGIFRVGAKIVHAMAQLVEESFKLFLHLESAVVSAEGNQFSGL